ncbi:MAG: hypothetical protein ACOH1I_09210 [Gallionellaceae bacterium]
MLVALLASLLAAHGSETIQYFSSDAANFSSCLQTSTPISNSLKPALFLIGSPIFLMKLADGDLFLIQLFNLLLMGLALKAALECLPYARAGSHFLLGVLVFPYFVFGFLSLNKEVYAMCSAILFGATS